MTKSFLTAQNISFNYDNQEKVLFSDFSASFPTGWTGIMGANGTGKSTFLKILGGLITPFEGRILKPGNVLYVDQVCEEVPDILFDLFAGNDSEALYLISILDLKYDWPYRWDTLSHGEKKRCQIGAAIAKNPDALLLDEPVNHLDQQSRLQVAKAMKEYKGCGVLVSHSRELLDQFCCQSVFIPEGRIFPGGYTKAMKEWERLKVEEKRAYESARIELNKLTREAANRRVLAANQHKRRSKKNLDLKDSDGRAKLDLARISGKDGTGGRLLRQMDGRINQAENRLNQFNIQKEIKMGITFTSKVQHSDFIWRNGKGNIYYNGLSGGSLFHDNLCIQPGDRLLVSGSNGTGKSTLLNKINNEIGALCWYLKQELGSNEEDKQREHFSELNRDERGRVISSLKRMGADPSDFLTLHKWSPGEIKKLNLAMALEEIIPGKTMILLDEPLNHLDLNSCILLEEALETFPGAIVIVSHERDFMKESITKEWHLVSSGKGADLNIIY